jgi:FkbM family methyltransferase
LRSMLTCVRPRLPREIRSTRYLHELRSRYHWEERARSRLQLTELLGLTENRAEQLRLLAAWHVLGLKAKWGPFEALRMRVRFPLDGNALSAIVADRSELQVLREVFVRQEYALPGVVAPKLIVDAGSNVGFSVLYFRSRFPAARIVAVEPDAATFARLRENTEGLGGVELVNAAMSDRDGDATLYAGSESWAMSLIPGADRTRREAVRAVTLDSLVDELSLGCIDVLKLDIEGAEIPVLRSTTVLGRVRVIVFEYHREYADVALWELLEHLKGFRLRRFDGNSESHATVVLEREDKPDR